MRKLQSALAAGAALSALAAACPALAADLAVKAPPVMPVVAPVYNWTGFYIGGNVGGAWVGNNNVTDSIFGVNFNNNGSNNGRFIGGGEVGFNYQYNNFVFGVEGDFDWAANSNNSSNGIATPAGILQVTDNDRWVSTVAARFGVAFDRWLVYGKAGGGWVGSNSFTVNNLSNGTSFTASNNNTDGGWLVGGGVEWAFAGNWSAKIEYDYLGLNSRSFTTAGFIIPAGDTFTISNFNVQMVKFGINYKFGWDAPVATRY